MKKILLVSYDWVPLGSVGMLRMLKFAKQLTKLGYGVSVLTRSESSKGSVSWDIDEPALQKIAVHKISPDVKMSFFRYLRHRVYSQLELDWYYAVLEKLNELLERIDFDIVISSSPPESAHLIAAKIKERKDVFWIADMRDLWSEDHYRNFGSLRKALFACEEKAVLSRADAITTVSGIWAGRLREQYGDKVSVITNGYDGEYFDKIPAKPKDKFIISYLGKLNSAHQNVGDFLIAVKELLDGGIMPKEKIESNFYITGYGKPDISALASSMGLSGVVREFDPVPFGTALDIMKNSSLLLLVGWKGNSSAGWRPQKVYEYLGSGNPIMLINGTENTELISILAPSKINVLADSVSDIKRGILKHYAEFKDGSKIAPAVAPTEYSIDRITKELCKIIENASLK